MPLIEIKSSLYPSIPKNDSITRFPLINAVISGIQKGRIFRIDSHDLFIIHKAGFSLVSSPLNSQKENSFLNFIKSSTDIPVYFHIYEPSSSLTSILERNEGAVKVRVRKRVQLRLKDKTSLDSNLKIEADLQVGIVDHNNFDSLNQLELELDNKFWQSKEDFLQNGLGVCILNSIGVPISICYSACIADGIVEIDIKTNPQYQRMGFAQIAVKKFIRICLDKGMTPNWDCFVDNVASMETALKAGFEVVHEYPFLSVFNKKENI